MKAVNAQTQFLLEKLRSRQKEAAAEGKPLPSPFDALDKGRKALGKEWDPVTKRMAVEALALWVINLAAGICGGVMNDIATVGQLAADSSDEASKKAAFELARSMEFIEMVVKQFAEAMDFEYIAEQLFEDGFRASEAAAAKEPAKSAFAKKCEPSAN